MHEVIFQNFIDYIRRSDNKCVVPQQRRDPFNISIVNNNGVIGFLVEKRVMPLDTFFPIDIFFFVIRKLIEAPNNELLRGDAMNYAIGQPGLEVDTVEAIVAIEFYNAAIDDFIPRRISVIANILVRSGACEHGKGTLRLRNFNTPSKNLPPENLDLIDNTNPQKTTPPKSKNILNQRISSSNEVEEKSVPDYLIKNGTRILNMPPQNINLITRKYRNERFMNFPIMQKFYNYFPDLEYNSIQRKEVSELFRKKKYYLGFITAMIWGGINASRPKKENEFETIDFYRVLKQDQARIEKIIFKVKQLLVKGQYENCFNYLNSEGKIDGVGHAYYTKLMYFIGYNDRRIKLKPLIFDKWTSNAYLALLIDTGQDEKIQKFYTGRIDKKNKTVSLRKNVSKAYYSFITDMDSWATELGISSSRLEEFIFGMSLKTCKSGSNPRRELWKIILRHIDKG